MYGNDNIMCCLLPNKCNLYNQPTLVHISTFVFFDLNVVFVIFILVMTICSLQLIWNQHIKVMFLIIKIRVYITVVKHSFENNNNSKTPALIM